MPKAVQELSADSTTGQPRRSSRTTTREQTLLEKEAKKMEEAQILASLPPGQKYFYLGPDGKPVIEPVDDPVAPPEEIDETPAKTGVSTPDAQDLQDQPWINVSHKKHRRAFGRKKNHVGAKPLPASPNARTDATGVPATTPKLNDTLKALGSTSPRPSADIHPSYAAAVRSKTPPIVTSPSKRPRSDSIVTDVRADERPVAKKQRVPPVTACRRVELADAAEVRSRQELASRKTGARNVLEMGTTDSHRTADAATGTAELETTGSSGHLPSIALTPHISKELDTRKADRKAALLAHRAGPPHPLPSSTTASSSKSSRPGNTSSQLDSVKTAHSRLRADARAIVPTPTPTKFASPSHSSSSEEDQAEIPGSSPAPDGRILSLSPTPGSRPLSPSPAPDSRTFSLSSAPENHSLSPSPAPRRNAAATPFSTGWEGYNSEEDRAAWAHGLPSSSVSSPAREPSPDLLLESVKRIVGIPPPLRVRPNHSSHAQGSQLSATRLPAVQLPHEALSRSTDPLYAVRAEHRVGPTQHRHNVQGMAHTTGKRMADLGSPAIISVAPQLAPSRKVSSKPRPAGHALSSDRSEAIARRVPSAYIEDIPDSDSADATADAGDSGLAPARRYRHTKFFPEPLDGADLHEQLIKPDPYPTKKGGRKGYLYPALKFSPAIVDGAEELLKFKNSMARDFECLDDTLSKPVAAKRRPQLVRSLFRAGQHLAEIGPSIVLAIHMQLDGASGIDAWTNPHTRFHLPGLVEEVVQMVHSRTADIRGELSASSASATTNAARNAQKALERVGSGAGYSNDAGDESSFQDDPALDEGLDEVPED